MSKYIPVDPEKWCEMVKAVSEVDKLKVEVECLKFDNERLKGRCMSLESQLSNAAKEGKPSV